MSIDLSTLSNAQLNDLVQQVEQRRKALRSETIEKARKEVHRVLAAEGLTFEDVFGGSRGRSARAGVSKVKPKYQNPANPAQQWSGRGLKPRWFADALQAGKNEKDLLIS